MYKLKNTSRSRDRIIYARNGRPVTIKPGETVEVDIPEAQALRIENTDGDLQVKGGSESKDVQTKPVASRETEKPAEKDAKTDLSNPDGLIKAYEDKKIKYSEFVDHAKEMLGDKFPKSRGIPKRDDVIKALRKA